MSYQKVQIWHLNICTTLRVTQEIVCLFVCLFIVVDFSRQNCLFIVVDFSRQNCLFVTAILTNVTYEKSSLLGHRMLENLILILFPENSPQNV
jgi:hypothetical protein